MDIKILRQELTDKVKNIDPLGKKLKFNLDGEIIMIDGRKGENSVSDNDEDADCTITMSMETYVKLQKKEIKPMIATLTGKIKVKGDIGLACINNGNAIPNKDGSYFIYLSHDPMKVDNWISTAGYKEAIIFCRWLLAEDEPGQPTVELCTIQ